MLLAKILYKRHKPVLKECVELIFNLLFKCFLVLITLLVVGSLSENHVSTTPENQHRGCILCVQGYRDLP
jgi:hypothetical protein